ncbi:MAG: AraC family transcriptional regulator [Methylobacter sp.]|nr:AraC family transcriptional regulator [Methylobacter sp.]MDP2097515.1 AraC family transcriptional regulator [Methylobacter sp.]MDP2429356.1 AraC family transcriptional regulator [Methylobacter sp.]MDP3362764.1 AraC family transcriptional regulator [Methylobacter sp.]MDZ4218772.1 AraC family transcriptional regulator [Methylobacter sp.]
MDALTALVNALNLRAKLVYSGGVCGRWLMDHNSDSSVWFHLVSKGQGWVHSPSRTTPLALESGDLVLFLPHAARHFLSYSAEHLPGDAADTRLTGWEGGESGFVCGEIELATPRSLLWQALPAEIVIKKNQAGDILAKLIELVINEASAQRFGSDSVVERLCDSLFVLVIRHCIEEDLVREGVFAAMQDRRLATALGLIHQQPWQPWTIAELCSRSGLSKTVLSEKFAALIGSSPIEYLIAWRLQIAAQWLKEPNMTLERVAERCGYDSAAAFSKAFKRCFKISPSAFRRIPE